MNRFKIIILFIVVTSISAHFCAFGQPMPINGESFRRVDFLSPQTANFVKYGNVRPSLYTGQLGFGVPLFTAKDNDFQVSATLNNNSDGFKPTQATGSVGMNWYLSVGGAIARKVNGYPDDWEANPSQNINDPSYSGMGFYKAAKKVRDKLPAVSKDDIFNFSVGKEESFWLWNVGYYLERPSGQPQTNVIYDYDPDEFSFNFMGHTGKFFIANDGTPRVISEERIQVTLDGFTPQSLNTDFMPFGSVIVLTTADGYKYYFGGSPQYLEFSILLFSDTRYMRPVIPVINSWNLRKVVAPSGKELNLTYKSYQEYLNQEPSPLHDANHYILNYSPVQMAGFTELTNYFWDHPIKNYSSFNTVGDAYSVTKTSYIERISSENFSLVFEYSEKPYKTQVHLSEDYQVFNDKTLQLNSIKYNAKNGVTETLLSSATLTYSYFGSGSPRHFLTSVQESGKNPYTFTYYGLDAPNTSTLPPTITHQVDHWGYWNGYSSSNPSNDMIPDVTIDDQNKSGDVTISGLKRAPNSSFAVVGMLKTVTYPTGGSSTFEYQGNDYSHRLERTASTNFYPGIVTTADAAGGVRIYRISDYNGNSTENVREYRYKSGYLQGGTVDENAPSSGFLMDYPRYLHFWTIDNYYQNLRMSSNPYGANYNTSEPVISYSEVTEITNGIGYKVYKYSNYESNPDIKDDNERYLAGTDPNLIKPMNLYKNYIGYRLNNRARDRGKLRFLNAFDANKNPVSSVENIYTPASTVNYTVGILAGTGNFSQSYKIYEDNPRLYQTINRVWNSGQAIATTQTFYYDGYGQLYKKTGTSSKGEALETLYRYPYDLAGGSADPTGVYLAMKNSHVISNVITEQTTRGGNQTSYKISNYYSPATGIFRPQSIQQQGLSNGPLETFANYTYSSAAGWNIESSSRPSGSSTGYIWGYNKQYPIMEARNALPNEIYHNNFEDETDFPSGLVKEGFNPHTGRYVGRIINPNPSELVMHSNTWLQVNLNAQPKKFRYSGWVYSMGPSVEIFLFMKRPGETAYFSYVDLVSTTETNKWVYLDKEFTVPGDVSQLNLRLDVNSDGSVWFDDLIIAPADAQISTYTYAPQVGITSETNTRGETTYYHYDFSQRLQRVLDKDGNVLKDYEYHYKQ